MCTQVPICIEACTFWCTTLFSTQNNPTQTLAPFWVSLTCTSVCLNVAPYTIVCPSYSSFLLFHFLYFLFFTFSLSFYTFFLFSVPSLILLSLSLPSFYIHCLFPFLHSLPFPSFFNLSLFNQFHLRLLFFATLIPYISVSF